MQAFERESMTVVTQGDGVDVRVEEAGGMAVGFCRFPKGADWRPLLEGLPGDMCQCPHWGYVLKGRIRMHTPDGPKDYVAGQAFYWAPGHAGEAVEDVEYIDFSPLEELKVVNDHVNRKRASG